MNLRAGDWVRVRSHEEILATLDQRGCLDDLPFMPQMVRFCGRRFQVSKRAHKLCDTVHGTGARGLRGSVFLEDLRCDGQLYGGCEMECLIVWKESWLEQVDQPQTAGHPADRDVLPNEHSARLEALALANVRPPERQIPGGVPVFSCQATQMPAATTRLSVWDPRQYVEDYRSGNATLGEILSVLFFLIYDAVATSGLGIGSFMRWSYDRVQWLRGGTSYPSRLGKLPRNARTPAVTLGVCPGEIVRVKSHSQVLETVNEDLVNRGMSFHPEMVPYCGQTFRVKQRLRRIMNEKNGQILELKNQCLVLEGVPCVGRYTKPLLCPRGMSPYWREIWLERIDENGHRPEAVGCHLD